MTAADEARWLDWVRRLQAVAHNGLHYATNAFDLAPVMNNADLYWPTFVRVKLK